MSKTYTVSTRKLGLAAYMKIQGCKLLGLDGHAFKFESDRPLDEWTMEYANSCCSRHDAELISLRNMRKG